MFKYRWNFFSATSNTIKKYKQNNAPNDPVLNYMKDEHYYYFKHGNRD